MTDSVPHHIYQIVHRESGRRYIGCTKHPIEKRFRQHVVGSRVGYFCTALCDEMSVYGPDAFDLSLIEVVLGKAAAHQRETFWMREFGTIFPGGYNQNGAGQYTKARIGAIGHAWPASFWAPDGVPA